eukprot:CAMPEP_0195583518 /NCGR_PEP_ID=MMETSP0814-20130614/24242_1 /TAXON_ID=97485 /ORGANISM="Prymnesium parvum, Strain Texoma1" /LENGTH=51 /DNA_ID=CAMNT_0040721371 /DNA_START=16 /DNA_END=168 /DNA_ORIENTATION=+
MSARPMFTASLRSGSSCCSSASAVAPPAKGVSVTLTSSQTSVRVRAKKYPP